MDQTKLLYAESHEWAHIEGENCTIGITKFAVDQLTDIVYVELPPIGKKLTAGQTFGVIESVKAVSDLYSPFAGEVTQVNNKVTNDPAILSKEPYEGGWLVKLRLTGTPDTSKMLSKDKYDSFAASSHH